MATATLILYSVPGKTVTLDLYPSGSDTASFTGVTMTEATHQGGKYTGTVDSPTPGDYDMVVKFGGVQGMYDMHVTLENVVGNYIIAGGEMTLTPAYDAAKTALQSGGPWTLTVVVDDGMTALEGVRVRLVSNVDQPNGATLNVDGVPGTAQIILHPGTRTYSTAIRLAGYQFTPSSGIATGGAAVDSAGNITMTDDGAVTFSMVEQVITPASDPNQTNAYLTTYDAQGTALAGVVIQFQYLGTVASGQSIPGAAFTATSNGSGDLVVALAQASHYRARRNSPTFQGDWVDIPNTGTGGTFELPGILGGGDY